MTACGRVMDDPYVFKMFSSVTTEFWSGKKERNSWIAVSNALGEAYPPAEIEFSSESSL